MIAIINLQFSIIAHRSSFFDSAQTDAQPKQQAEINQSYNGKAVDQNDH
jgi:hypothetical protein